jgi:prepilin-type N-terminal cleavage/methylation domain-containing protein/prepilin-type processing-associated H-X9-DG protein
MHAFTLIEVLIVVAIIALLISILLPALSKARQSGYSVACAARLREQLAAAQTYASENEDMLPVGVNFDWERAIYPQLSSANYFQDILIPYVGGVESDGMAGFDFSAIFRCPAVEHGAKQAWLLEPNQNHYRYNPYRCFSPKTGFGRSIGSVRRSSVAVLAYDIVYSDWKDTDLFPHVGSKPFINVGYVDGHVGVVSAQAYLAASPRPPRAEGTNQFLKEGWD